MGLQGGEQGGLGGGLGEEVGAEPDNDMGRRVGCQGGEVGDGAGPGRRVGGQCPQLLGLVEDDHAVGVRAGPWRLSRLPQCRDGTHRVGPRGLDRHDPVGREGRAEPGPDQRGLP